MVRARLLEHADHWIGSEKSEFLVASYALLLATAQRVFSVRVWPLLRGLLFACLALVIDCR